MNRNPYGFKVAIHRNQNRQRIYDIYQWDYVNQREIPVTTGKTNKSLRRTQAIARIAMKTLQRST